LGARVDDHGLPVDRLREPAVVSVLGQAREVGGEALVAAPPAPGVVEAARSYEVRDEALEVAYAPRVRRGVRAEDGLYVVRRRAVGGRHRSLREQLCTLDVAQERDLLVPPLDLVARVGHEHERAP